MSASRLQDPRPSADQRAATTRARIEAVAEALFRRIGYQKTTVADIARELSMSPANVYRFFPSKSAINEAIAAHMLDGVMAGAEAIASGPGPAAARLRALLHHLFESDLRLFIQERRMHDMVEAAMTEHWAVVERFVIGIKATIARILADGIADGAFAPIDTTNGAEMVKTATMVWTHPRMLSDCLRQGRSEAELKGQLDVMVDFLLRALRA
ncbi:TetR/AcrR family transcriptional regulator [Humitalea sp. 24SJ18S-53]|uniref:TetR/AcrR family transcriptional regulator n=1 Tax=Humitalea sp. 24SJ18S-53 TaxID=3422307 RepID=UPI003D66C599